MTGSDKFILVTDLIKEYKNIQNGLSYGREREWIIKELAVVEETIYK